MASINIQNKQSVPVISVNGRLDTISSPDFDQALQPLYGKTQHLIIDLASCSYLSSSGIRSLLVATKRLKSDGGTLYISGMKPEVFQVIEMAGLHRVFKLSDTTEEAIGELMRPAVNKQEPITFSASGTSFHYDVLEEDKKPALCWKDAGIAGYDELGFAVGQGCFAESHEAGTQQTGLFVVSGCCAALMPEEAGMEGDFRIPQNPSQAGMFVNEGVSFPKETSGLLSLNEEAGLTTAQLAEAASTLRKNLKARDGDHMLLVIADPGLDAPSVSIAIMATPQLQNLLNNTKLPIGDTDIRKSSLCGIRYVLDQMPNVPKDASIQTFLGGVLSFENIIKVETLETANVFSNPKTWVFLSDGCTDASENRLKIKTHGDFTLQPHEAFLTRRLYADSSRLLIKMLHGGFSAQTFQVESFDHDGRKLRPTVLKIAPKDMISRESERCRLYAMPYILNNSAMVLGAEFYGNTGVMRYNFVGIGGEGSQLKWIAHYYQEWPLEKLEPLFDKVFLQILKPWYGQAVRQDIHPFRDHDPTLTFFPHIYEQAKEVLSITPDEEYITIRENGRQITNPYWFLKYKFPELREWVFNYHTAICHGDLNLQNILLDENMNVYLIDFSETKPRSAISDFARLEDIFMLDFAPIENEADMHDYIDFVTRFYDSGFFSAEPEVSYNGRHAERVRHNVRLALKMREYALKSVGGDTRQLPYLLAMFEWMAPIVCYIHSKEHKYVSMVVAGLLCDKIRQLL